VNAESSSIEPDLAFLRVAAARYRLGYLKSAELPGLASKAMDAGVMGDDLAELVCTRESVMSEHGPMFERVLRQCEIAMPSEEEAVDCLLRECIKGIASGETSTRDGLYDVWSDFYLGHFFLPGALERKGLSDLIGAYYFYDQFEEPDGVSYEGFKGQAAVEAFGRHVRGLAVKWLREHGETG
jgi:hypothetical protein